MSDTCGHMLPTPFADYDRGSRSWRTSQGIYLWGSEEFSETWPRRGMTRNGCAYRLPLPGHLTAGSEYSLLPTPRTSRGGSGTETIYALGGFRTDLTRTQGRVLLPTPTTSEATGIGEHSTVGTNLRKTVSRMRSGEDSLRASGYGSESLEELLLGLDTLEEG